MKCDKVRHPSKKAALATLRKLNNKGMKVYLCSICKCWHLGNSAMRQHKVDRMAQLLSPEYREQMIQKYRRKVAMFKRAQPQ